MRCPVLIARTGCYQPRRRAVLTCRVALQLRACQGVSADRVPCQGTRERATHTQTSRHTQRPTQTYTHPRPMYGTDIAGAAASYAMSGTELR
eukprot:51367-Rhodomonas_salina.5